MTSLNVNQGEEKDQKDLIGSAGASPAGVPAPELAPLSLLEQMRAWPINAYGWHVGPNNVWVKLGNGVKLGDGVTLGNDVTLGNYVKLGDGVTLGNDVKFPESPLQIQGTKHLAYICDNDGTLKIGCEAHPIARWEQDYIAIGVSNGYTKEQIREYKGYIDLFAARAALSQSTPNYQERD